MPARSRATHVSPKSLVNLELEGVNESFAGRFARGLAEPEEVNLSMRVEPSY